MATENEILIHLRDEISSTSPGTPQDWLPLMRAAGTYPIALDYIRDHGCKYKSIRSCKAAAANSRRAAYRKDPIEHLNPDTIKEYKSLDYEVVWGLYNSTGNYDNPANVTWAPAIYMLSYCETRRVCITAGVSREMARATMAWHGEDETDLKGAQVKLRAMRDGLPLWEGLYPDAEIGMGAPPGKDPHDR